MSDTNLFNMLRLRYKVAFDTYRAISTRNAELRKNGEPSEQARADEERAAADLKEAQRQLMAATARIGQ